MALFGLLKPRPHERAAFSLYGQAVGQARLPVWYESHGVPDTLDGRFDMVGVFTFLLIDRLQADAEPAGTALAQAVFDAMFADMDQTLREMGVGDLAVGKRVKAMWTAFNGRAHAYSAALDQAPDDLAPLVAALSRNVWRSPDPVPGAAGLAAHMLAVRGALAGQALAGLADGHVTFPAPG